MTEALVDVQSHHDAREIAINEVGICGLRHPIKIIDKTALCQTTIASCQMGVSLAAEHKGTHMSRFIRLLDDWKDPLSVHQLETFLKELAFLLKAEDCFIQLQFPFFVQKTTPISGFTCPMDYDVTLKAQLKNNTFQLITQVVVPATSLCPASKSMSNYGAHNQRSHLTLEVISNPVVWIEDLINIAEKNASSEVYSYLKRNDEKHVTEAAYDNPKFVEDIVRDMACELNCHKSIQGYRVHCENFESIHNHSAYAEIKKNWDI